MLCLIGLNYKNSLIREREKFAVQKPDTAFTTGYFFDNLNLKECVLLSTCNRFELYCAVDSKNAAAAAAEGILNYYGADSQSTGRFYILFAEDAARHLFKVVSGLDSMVIGEHQILSQVKFAYSAACEAKTTGYTLNKLFHQAIKIGKAARSETAISSDAVSFSGAAVAAARKELNGLAGRSSLLIGSGETAEMALGSLIKSGVEKSAVISRTFEHASALAAKYGARAYGLCDLYNIISGFDIIVSSTDSPHYIITLDHFTDASKFQCGYISKKQVLIDLAVPRDIDPSLASIENIKLYNIDDLNIIINKTMVSRKKEAIKVEKIIDEGITDFLDWYEERGVKPFIEKFRNEIEKIVFKEIDKFGKKLPDSIKNKEKSLSALKQALINRICARPISRVQKCSAINKIYSCIKTFECFFDNGRCMECEAASDIKTCKTRSER